MKTNAKIEIEIFDNGCMKVSAEGEFSDANYYVIDAYEE